MIFFQKKPWGAKQISLETGGSIRADGIRGLLEAMQSVATGLIDPSLVDSQKEGCYDEKTLTWKDADGGEHTQRCNARRLAEDRPNTPDFY